jgi:2-phosphoglycolate phosphatase
MSVSAVLFDLDGTLVDTAPDLVAVLNQMLREHGRAPMPYAVARNEVSNGALALIRLGFGGGLDDAELEPLRQRFLEIYADQALSQSRIFIDTSTLFDPAAGLKLPWGIVTNKAQAMTARLLQCLGIADDPACIVCGDQLPQRKPHPAPLRLAAHKLGLAPERCVYVGDALRDIQAGRAAGMQTIAVTYGYIRPSDDPVAWGADLLVRRPSELNETLLMMSAAPSRAS